MITSELSWAPLTLIRDGATLIRDERDLLEELGLEDASGLGRIARRPRGTASERGRRMAGAHVHRDPRDRGEGRRAERSRRPRRAVHTRGPGPGPIRRRTVRAASRAAGHHVGLTGRAACAERPSPGRVVDRWSVCARSQPTSNRPEAQTQSAAIRRDDAPSDEDLVAAFVDHLLLERRLSPHTAAAYRGDLSSLAVFLGRAGTDLAGASHLLIRRWLAQLHTRGYARSSLARKAAAVRAFYGWAERRGLVPRNPASSLAHRAEATRLPVVLKQGEVASVVSAPGEDPVGLRDLAVLELLYGSGIRVSELCGLDLDDVDLGGRRVRVLGKGAKERVVPFGDFAAAALSRYLEESRPHFLAGTPATRHLAKRPTERCSSTAAIGGSGPATCAICSPATRGRSGRNGSVPTRSATPTPPISWKGEPTSEPSRNSSVTPAWPPRSATRTCRGAGCSRPTGRATPEPDASRQGGGRQEPQGGQDRLADLWRRFKAEGSQEARDQLILQFAPLVKYVASRVATGLPATVEQADLVSYGMFGLIDALEKFDLDRGIKFETYAIPRIRGAIIDELRSLDWVPRSVRFKARELDKAYAEVEARLKRAPTDPEVAEHLGMSVSELHDIVTQISFVSVIALDEPPTGGDRGESVSLLDTLAEQNTDP